MSNTSWSEDVDPRTQTEKQQLPEDRFAKKYTKTAKSTYCYTNDITDRELKLKLVDAEEKKEFEYENFWWTLSGGIVFKKTKEEHEEWAKKFPGGRSFAPKKKVKEIDVIFFDKFNGLNDLNGKLDAGWQFFGETFAQSCVVQGDQLLIGMVKREA